MTLSRLTSQIQAERNEQLELVKVVSVQTQVVAGMNYRFVLDTATPSQELHTFEATVYGTSCFYNSLLIFIAWPSSRHGLNMCHTCEIVLLPVTADQTLKCFCRASWWTGANPIEP